jgi:hypothetical protein
MRQYISRTLVPDGHGRCRELSDWRRVAWRATRVRCMLLRVALHARCALHCMPGVRCVACQVCVGDLVGEIMFSLNRNHIQLRGECR